GRGGGPAPAAPAAPPAPPGVPPASPAAGRPPAPRLGTDRSTTGLYEVRPASGSTAYVRFGDWAVYAAVAWLAVAGGVVAVRRVRGRGDR
ncbi:hypothetical protein ACFV3O_23620, partial [Streptomyces albidoflavus]